MCHDLPASSWLATAKPPPTYRCIRGHRVPRPVHAASDILSLWQQHGQRQLDRAGEDRPEALASADVGGGNLADSDKFAEHAYLGAATMVKAGRPAVSDGLDLSGHAHPGPDRSR